MYIKHNGKWVEADVLIKNGGKWKDADPMLKTGGKWKNVAKPRYSFIIKVGNENNTYYGYVRGYTTLGTMPVPMTDRNISGCVTYNIFNNMGGEISWKDNIHSGTYEIFLDGTSYGRSTTKYDSKNNLNQLQVLGSNLTKFHNYIKSKVGKEIKVTITKI